MHRLIASGWVIAAAGLRLYPGHAAQSPWTGEKLDLAASHAIPALMRTAQDARLSGAPPLDMWGTVTLRRGGVHVDDCADAAMTDEGLRR